MEEPTDIAEIGLCPSGMWDFSCSCQNVGLCYKTVTFNFTFMNRIPNSRLNLKVTSKTTLPKILCKIFAPTFFYEKIVPKIVKITRVNTVSTPQITVTFDVYYSVNDYLIYIVTCQVFLGNMIYAPYCISIVT
jgi:hypothetical protein